MALRSNSMPVEGPYPTVTGGPNLSLVSDMPEVKDAGLTIEDGSITIQHADGSVTVDFDPLDEDDGVDSDDFSRNLAVKMPEADLAQIASDLLDGIDRDEMSRQDWLNTRAQGIDLLGLKIEKPRADNVSGSAPVEGMSTVRHPVLLEATINFQATARAELLPASGPVKVRNDSPPAPDLEIQDTSARAELIESIQRKDELAQALEVDMNHYLTATATEYVPDTDRMLFYVGFGGDGFKKVYNCPLRGRPVSESIDAKDLIISNAATDLNSCGRVTHRIMMRKSILKRMQILGVYRDVELTIPQATQSSAVDAKVEELSLIHI